MVSLISLTDIFRSAVFERIAKSAGFILAAVLVWFIFKKVYMNTIAKRERVDNLKGEEVTGSFTSAVMGAVKIALIIFTVLSVLEINGVNVTSLITGLGIAGAVAGLALQDFIKDTIMGLRIVADKFYRVGDVIKYNDVEGIVIEFSLRSTRIRSIDTQDEITISNRNIDAITKRSHLYDIDIPISYDEDFRRVNAVMYSISKDIGAADGIESCQYKGTQSFDSSSIKYRIRIFCMPEERPELRRMCLRIIQNRLDAEGIHIPFDQLDVHTYPAEIPLPAAGTDERDLVKNEQ